MELKFEGMLVALDIRLDIIDLFIGIPSSYKQPIQKLNKIILIKFKKLFADLKK